MRTMHAPTTPKCRTCKFGQPLSVLSLLPVFVVLTESLKHNLPVLIYTRDGRIGDSDTFYTEWEETYESFDQMGLHENLLRGIYAYGGFLAAVTLSGQPLALVQPAFHYADCCEVS